MFDLLDKVGFVFKKERSLEYIIKVISNSITRMVELFRNKSLTFL